MAEPGTRPERQEKLEPLQASVRPPHLVQVEDYEPFVGAQTVDRIRAKAAALRDVRVVNFNATYYGGGVAEMLSSLTLLMNSVGIKAEWRGLPGDPPLLLITNKNQQTPHAGPPAPTPPKQKNNQEGGCDEDRRHQPNHQH